MPNFLTKSITRKDPYENAIAFGGVAIGKEKANEEAMVAGTPTNKGLAPVLKDSLLSKGRKTLAVLVLLATSARTKCFSNYEDVLLKDVIETWVAQSVILILSLPNFFPGI